MRTLLIASVLLLAPACGGGGGDDGGGGIDGGDGDSDASSGADAEVGGGISIGDTCAIDEPTSCGDLDCIALTDGTNPWCTTPCTMMGMTDPACSDVYDGPGLVGCFFTVTPAGGGDPMKVCAVACDAPDNQCPPDVCDGTCPGTLVCTPSGTVDGVSFCE